MSIDNKLIGNIFKKYREYQNITQEKIARELGVSRITYARYEKGTSQFPLDVFLNGAKFLNIPLNELIEEIELSKINEQHEKNKVNAIINNKFFWIFLSSFVFLLFLFGLFIYAYLNPLYYNQNISFLWRFLKFDKPELIAFNFFLYLILALFITTLSLGIGGIIHEYLKKTQN